jgi:hypothetical protein
MVEGFAERGKKQAMTDLRGILSNWFKNQFCLLIRLSWLRALATLMLTEKEVARLNLKK